MAAADAYRFSHAGACHCGNITFHFHTDSALADLQPRRCICNFCRQHGAVYVADKLGLLRVSCRDHTALSRYRQSTGTADFLICGHCGVLVLVSSKVEGNECAVINATTLHEYEALRQPVAVDFDGESTAARLQRRGQHWIGRVEFEPAST